MYILVRQYINPVQRHEKNSISFCIECFCGAEVYKFNCGTRNIYVGAHVADLGIDSCWSAMVVEQPQIGMAADQQCLHGTAGLTRSLVVLSIVIGLFVALIVFAFASLPPFIDSQGQERQVRLFCQAVSVSALSPGMSPELILITSMFTLPELPQRRVLGAMGWLADALQMYTLLPRNLEQLQQFRGMLLAYTEENYGGVLLVFSLLYIFKQTFSIPGSVLMNVVGGALLGLPVGFPLCCLLSAVGASCCFWLSHFIGEPVVSRVMGTKLKQLRTTIVSTDSLLLYLIFIRIFPITPNWAINLASPLIHVPFVYFFLSVFLGKSRRMQCW